jgi:hypothetical protein
VAGAAFTTRIDEQDGVRRLALAGRLTLADGREL